MSQQDDKKGTKPGRRGGHIKATEVDGVSNTASSLALRLRKAQAGDDQAITQKGKVTAVVVSPDEWENMQALGKAHPEQLGQILGEVEERNRPRTKKQSNRRKPTGGQ